MRRVDRGSGHNDKAGGWGRVQVEILGPLRVYADDGRLVDIGGARLRALLCRLALAVNSVVTVEALIDGLWAESAPAGATNALQSLVSRLRRVLPDGAVESLPAGYRLAAQVDADEFERLAAQGRQALARGDAAGAADLLARALRLYRGEPLVDVTDAPFAAAPAARLAELRLAALEDRLAADLALGRHAEVVAEVDALSQAHPMRERLHAHLVTALYGAGRRADALAAYQRIRQTLADELGVDPSPELAAAHLAVLRGVPPASAADTAADEPPTNLRAALTSFVGRDEELSKVAKALEDNRLVTLLGPGGAGKTRLAAEVGNRVSELLPDGRWLVELAPVTDVAEVPQAVLAALGVRESNVMDRRREISPNGPDALGRVVRTLAGKRALLILDNAEHLIDAVARLADHVLARCPQLRVLATSREPLGITGETLYVLPPLATPPPGTGCAEAMEYAAVRLFADRGNAALAGFAVDESNAAAVVQVCQRLDGLPLALELAAARLRALSVEQIAARLDDRFRLLTGGSRTALPRHRTLAAVVDWSWDLLADAERVVLRRLSVFPPGATLAAAEHTCAGDDVPPESILDLLAALVDKSLVEPARGRDGEQRYRLLETIRAYGAERLAQAGEADDIRARHAAYFLAMSQVAEEHLRGHEQLDWLARLSAENDNLVAALRWAIDTRQADLAVQLAQTIGAFWLLRGSRTESAMWLSEALAVPGDGHPMARAATAAMLGMALLGVGNLPDAVERFRTARELMLAHPGQTGHPILIVLGPINGMLSQRYEDAWEETNRNLDHPDPWARAMSRLLRGHLLANNGDVEQAEADLVLALEEFRANGDRLGRAMTTGALGWYRAMGGDNAGAVVALTESLGMLSEIGAIDEMAEVFTRLALARGRDGDIRGALADLAEGDALATRYSGFEAQVAVAGARAELARLAGDLDEATRCYDRALEMWPRDWASFGQPAALALSGLAYVDVAAGRPAAARQRMAEAMTSALASRDMPVVADVTQAAADLALAEGDPALAARLLGIAVALRGTADEGSPDVRRIRAAAGEQLGPAYQQAYEGGAALSRDAALEELSELLASP
jgi:predicted ATPase/DNA-binding SARP family transcriptional activator